MLIEDEKDHADLIQRALAQGSAPCRISHVETLAAGRAAAAQDLPDLALVDYRLPDGSGNEFVVWSAERFPVILLTAFGNERAAVEAIKAGALDYVIKSPEMFADVAHLVERALRDWRNLHQRKQAESRLEAINHLLATMGPDFTENTSRLITMLAKEFGAQFAFYSRIAGNKLCGVAQWRVDAHLADCVRCGCAACAEVLNYAAGQLQHIQAIQENPLASPMTLCATPTHAHLCHVVECHQKRVGILCLFFNRPYQMTNADRRLLGIFAAALGGEENRKRTDAELRASDERYRQIVQTANEGIWVTDEQDRVTFANHRLARMLGYAPEELLHRPARDFIVSADLADHENRLQSARQGQPSQFERRLRHKDGREFWTWVSGSPLLDDAGQYRGAFAMFTDVTERRQLESQLRQVQKLESVGQLAGGIAHDFNNILAAITMHLSLLRQNPALDEESTEALRELEVETKRAANLTRQLLMFSRRSVIQTRVVDLNELVQNLLKMLRRLLGENISISFDSQERLPAVEVDIGMIEQVLMNLAVNARDAMPKGGALTIATKAVQLNADTAKLHSERRPGQFVTLTVTDTGVGMDEGTLKRIFEPFFTTKDVGKGTGLGLPTAHGIVKQHHGWIEVQSQLDHGSVFVVYLPVKAMPAAATEPLPAVSPVLGGRGTVLLVEDEDIVRRPIGLYLRKLGYQVIEAGNGNQAVELWRRHRDQIDLLYTDMVMPEGVSGLDLAEKLRAEKPRLRVIISSGYSTEISMQGVPAGAGYLYLPKPSPSAAIAAAVRECLEKE
ncbi:MAG TPA: response regulator [Candidatus Acidoferrales bacterium]|nr:response regulator [Candidatus Acidoferrales bacterium]